jgi:autotransporter-associated beta strand protein
LALPVPLSFGDFSATLGGLQGSGSLALTSEGGDALALNVGNNNASTTFSGVLSGNGSLSKIGSGTLYLTGSNTYTGPTTISRGELVVNGSLASPATVNSGGILGGTGTLSSLIVSPSGQLAPGDPLGTLTVSGNSILGSRAAMNFGLDTPTTSSMIIAGNLVLNNQQFSDFSFTPTANFGTGVYDLITFGSSSGTLGSNVSGTIDGLPATLTLQSNDLVLTVVPEPSTAALLLVAGIIGLIVASFVMRAGRRADRLSTVTPAANRKQRARLCLITPTWLPPQMPGSIIQARAASSN